MRSPIDCPQCGNAIVNCSCAKGRASGGNSSGEHKADEKKESVEALLIQAKDTLVNQITTDVSSTFDALAMVPTPKPLSLNEREEERIAVSIKILCEGNGLVSGTVNSISPDSDCDTDEQPKP